MILTGRQIRKRRILAGLEQADLASAAGVALAPVVRVEAVDGMVMMRKPDTVTVRAALEATGVIFVPTTARTLG